MCVVAKRIHTTDYNTKQKKMKVVTALLILVMVLGLVMCLLMACGWLSGPTWEPDVVYPMTNQHIEWNYPGRK